MKAKAPSEYEGFILSQQNKMLSDPVNAVANDIPETLFRYVRTHLVNDVL